MVHRMVSVLFSASSRVDAMSGEIQFECYEFDGEQNNLWTRIHCNLNSQSDPIREDFTVRVHGNFSITNNWSMYDGRLKGQRVDQSIFCVVRWFGHGFGVHEGRQGLHRCFAMTSMQNQSIHA